MKDMIYMRMHGDREAGPEELYNTDLKAKMICMGVEGGISIILL